MTVPKSSGTPVVVSSKGCLRCKGWTMYSKRDEASSMVLCRKYKEEELEKGSSSRDFGTSDHEDGGGYIYKDE